MATEKRPVQGFHKITNTGTVNIEFTVSNEYSVELCGNQADLDRTFTVMHGDTLVISQDSHAGAGGTLKLFGMSINFGGGSGSSMGPVTAIIHAPAQKGFEDTGTGSIKCAGSYDLGNDGFEARITGTGNICLDNLVCGSDIRITNTGTGNVEISGIETGADMDIESMGTGSIRLSGRCGKVTARATGVGRITGSLSYTSITKSNLGLARIEL